MRLAVVGTIVLLLSGLAMAQTDFTVDYTIQIGGDNHETQYKNDENVAFTPGTTTPPVQDEATMGSVITWDVIAEASGSDIDGYSVQGVANLVFDIELQTEAGVPAAPAKFFSVINDGNTDSIRSQNNGVAEPFERAAFCLGWDVAMDYRWIDDGDGIVEPGEYFDGLGPPLGPGRLYDPVTVGGPNMDRVQFPSTANHGGGRMKGGVYFPDCNGNLIDDNTEENITTDADENGILDVCEDGLVSLPGTTGEPLLASKLSGMGAGYSQFTEAANNAGVGLAVASVIPNWGAFGDEWVGLGIKPVAEGQIDMTGLPEGTYKLVLTAPANSNNVIPPSYIVQSTPAMLGGFAAKAVVVNGAEVSFYWIPSVTPCEPRTAIAWKSIRTHGTTVGELAIALNATDGSASVEGRNNGIQKISVQFDGDLTKSQYAPGGVAITGGLTVTGETLATTAIANDTLILTLSGSADKTCYTIDVAGATGCPTGDTTCSVLTLVGDANGDKKVSTTDMALVKSRIGKPLGTLEIDTKADLNCDGNVSTTDLALCKFRVSPAVWTCP